MIILKTHEIFTLIQPFLPKNPIIIEAGAFDGSDTIRLAQTFPHGTIHSFEPVPEIFAQLKTNTTSYSNIHCYQQALSNYNGIATFYIAEKPDKPGKASQAGSLLPPKERLAWSSTIFPRTIEVPTIKLPTWAQQHSITHIDFLWLDMQGNELNVLKSAESLLPIVSVIYTEVGFVEGYKNQPTYKTVKQWLEQYNFIEYGRTFENTVEWFFGNVLFVKKNLYINPSKFFQ